VSWVEQTYQLSERRSCQAVGAARSAVRYVRVRPKHQALRQRMKELAAVRVRAGYRQLAVLLEREGWNVNHELVYRLYREEGLSLRRQKRRRHRTAVQREPRRSATAPNEVWAMDFVHDALSDGRAFRVFAAVDEFTRECLLLQAAPGFGGEAVSRLLQQTIHHRQESPRRLRVDNGPEFTSKAMDRWAYSQGIELDFSRPGKPTDNAFIESFNATFRRECLSQHWFASLDEVRQRLEDWRTDYNETRPHSAWGGLAPAVGSRQRRTDHG
jgi:putative transposase